jgi:hypothetical protein
MTDILKEYAQKALEAKEFYKANKIFAFREPEEFEKIMEKAVGEKIFLPPNPKQAELIKGLEMPDKKVFTFCGGNRLGKTTIGVITAFSVMFGRWPWSDKPIPFMHKRTRRVRYIGQGWETHVKTVVIPALKQWWPKSRPVEIKKNNQGVEAVWTDVLTGATLEVLSTSQASDVFEGWDGDLVVYDEPPTREIRIACARGLVDRQGRELIVATLLKEAWVSREIIKARDVNGQPDLSVYNVEGQIYDNVGYGLTIQGVEQFAKTLSAEERKVRLNGQPSYLSTLVYPKFDRSLHVKEPFPVPLDWIIDFNIDFHPSKPWAVVFMATARNGFKYIIKEMELRGNPKYVAEEIIRYLEITRCRIGIGQIDPLSKSDNNNDNTVYQIISDTLAAHNISLDVASKDKDNGIAMVNSLLWTENEMPGMFFFKDCGKTIQQVEDLMYDEESLKPIAKKVDDDFTECLYRLALLDTVWWDDRSAVNGDKNFIL